MVTKRFESVGLPALVRPVRLGFYPATLGVVSVIYSMEGLVVLGGIPWGKIKRRFSLFHSDCCLAVLCEYIRFITYSDLIHSTAVLRFLEIYSVNILANGTLLET